jgi:Arc/MetJ-type ribon-helix-helix transcriptional regulator
VKSLTVRLPEPLVAEIDAESRARKISKSDLVRERLQAKASTGPRRRRSTPLASVADLIGSVEGLPSDVSSRRKHYLKATRYGRKRPR